MPFTTSVARLFPNPSSGHQRVCVAGSADGPMVNINAGAERNTERLVIAK